MSGSRAAEVPVGHGQTRRGWVVVACLGYSRAGAGVLVFSTQTEDLLAGIAGCLERLGGAAADVGLGSPGRHPRPRRAPDGRVRRLLRAAEGRVAVLRAGRSAGQGRGRAPAGLRGDQLRARPRVRQRARLPGPARRLVREGQRAPAQDAARAPDRPAARSSASTMARAAGRAARHRPALGHAGRARSLSARRHQRLLARSRAWSAGASRSASTSARSPRSRSTPARSPAGTRGCSRAIARSPRSSTPAPCATGAARRPNPRSRSGRWPATTR